MTQFKVLFIIFFLSLLSGIADAQGFFHASKMWKNDSFVLNEFCKSVAGFSIGIFSYFFIVKYLQRVGTISPEIQSMLWFGVTIIGIAILSGAFFRWNIKEQIISILTILGICWLLLKAR